MALEETALELNGLRTLNAGNRGPFTLDGTRTFIVGHTQVAVIDPGPADEAHTQAIVQALEHAQRVSILLTHGHPDHVGAVAQLAAELEHGEGGVRPDVRVLGSGHPLAEPLTPGTEIGTDAGTLIAHALPGHTADHTGFEWRERSVLFVGDHLLGEGSTTWVAEYLGCVGDYLESLDRVDALEAAVLMPTHGPPLLDPSETVARFRAHRLARLEQVATAMLAQPGADADDLVRAVYGASLPPGMTGAARASIEAMREHIAAH